MYNIITHPGFGSYYYCCFSVILYSLNDLLSLSAADFKRVIENVQLIAYSNEFLFAPSAWVCGQQYMCVRIIYIGI